MPDQPRRATERRPSGEQLAGGVLAGQAKAVEDVGKRMLRNAPLAGRIVAKRIPGLPGLVFDGASIATAKDKAGATAEFGGGLAGAALGGLVGGPLGAAAGSVAGEMAGEYLYDHKDDIHAWMDARWNDLARQAGERVAPYTPINRINRAYRR